VSECVRVQENVSGVLYYQHTRSVTVSYVARRTEMLCECVCVCVRVCVCV